MTNTKEECCPHCQEALKRWVTPPDSTWGGKIHLVCFNDQCPYYTKGWKWMAEKYEAKASYRYKVNTDGRAPGPLPVWSDAALREWIVDEERGDGGKAGT